MRFIEHAKLINDAIFEAIETGYYNEELDFLSPNWYEIREWGGLEYIDPTDPNYSADDKILDDYIENTLKALWPIVNIFGINQ